MTNQGEPKRRIVITMSTIDSLTDRRLLRLKKLLEIADETSTSVDFREESEDQTFVEQVEEEEAPRNIALEVEAIEQVNEMLSSTNELSMSELDELKAIADSHQESESARRNFERTRKKKIGDWGKRMTKEGVKVVLRLFGVPV